MLKRGYGKSKGNPPYISFECSRIGHYASKCPHEELENSDGERECGNKI